MNCPHCQSILPEGAAFCARCGNKVIVPQPVADPFAQQYQQQKAALRQGEMNALGRLIEYFSPKQEEYDAYDQVCQKLLHYARGAKNALLIWGSIALGLFAFFMGVGIAEDAPGYELRPFLWLLLIPGILMITGGILMKVNNHAQMNRCREEYAQLSQSLFYHYTCYPNCPVGPEYTNPRVLHILLRTLNSGRCDTIKEAINCMVADANYGAITRYCQQIHKETAQINANTRVGTIFAAAKLFR